MELNNHLPTLLQQYLHKSKYARFVDDKQRRESWEETVDRYFVYARKYISESYGQALEEWVAVEDKLKSAVLNTKVMPSMRLMMTSGPAVERDHMAAYNCFAASINKKRRFADTLYILLNGTGVGFSCERQEINRLPSIPDQFVYTEDVISVKDSKKGWALAYRKIIDALYQGEIPRIDYSKIRPKGARLKTFGGRSSGPKALIDLVDFTIEVFKKAHNRKLTSIEVHDIMCKIGEVVVIGGVVPR
jgi:ribonucleoside-triphosphate reductase